MKAELERLGIDRMTAGERILLAIAIWKSVINDGGTVTLSDERKAVLQRRVDHMKDNPDSVVSWEELNAAMRDLFTHLK